MNNNLTVIDLTLYMSYKSRLKIYFIKCIQNVNFKL